VTIEIGGGAARTPATHTNAVNARAALMPTRRRTGRAIFGTSPRDDVVVNLRRVGYESFRRSYELLTEV
jgi:hypothetical protein